MEKCGLCRKPGLFQMFLRALKGTRTLQPPQKQMTRAGVLQPSESPGTQLRAAELCSLQAPETTADPRLFSQHGAVNGTRFDLPFQLGWQNQLRRPTCESLPLCWCQTPKPVRFASCEASAKHPQRTSRGGGRARATQAPSWLCRRSGHGWILDTGEEQHDLGRQGTALAAVCPERGLAIF